MIRQMFAFVIAAVSAYLCASVFSTLIVAQHMSGLDVTFSPDELKDWVVSDLMGLTSYLAVIVLGFLIAFFIAARVKKVLPSLALIAYPLAGAVMIGLALFLMGTIYGTVPIGGARFGFGFLLQMLAGAIGGAIFEVLRPKQ